MGNGDTAPRIVNPGAGAAGVRTPDTHRIVDGPQNRSDRCREEKTIVPLSEIGLHFTGRPVRKPSHYSD
jgi:hypothetical protein